MLQILIILDHIADKAILISLSTVFNFSLVFILNICRVDKADLHSEVEN